MKKIFKITGILLVSILLLLFIIPVLLAVFFDPNDYKDEISQLVEKTIHRKLTINGELDYSLFPWLGLEIGELRLGNAAGFKQTEFAKINTAQIRVELLPLFSKKVIVDKIVLDGLVLNLQKNKQGKTNWQDLLSKKPPKPDSAQSTTTTPDQQQKDSSNVESAMVVPAIAGIEIKNATIRWDDNSLDKHYILSQFNLDSGALLSGNAIPFSCNFSVSANQPALSANTKLSATLTLKLAQQFYQIDNLKLVQTVTPKGQKSIKFELATKTIQADLNKQTAKISEMSLSALDITVNSSFTASNILNDLKLTGHIRSNEFIPKDLFSQLDIPAPVTADKSVFSKARFETQIALNLSSVSLKKLKIILDDSTITGYATVKTDTNKKSLPLINYSLKLDEINADRYLPPPVPANKSKTTSSSKAATNPSQPAQAEILLPTELMRSLNINGKMAIGKAIVSKLHSTDINMTLRANKGLIRIHPLSAKLYQGRYNGDIQLDVRQKVPRYSLNESLEGIQFGPLLKDFVDDDYVLGRAKLKAKLITRGMTMHELRQNLNGNADFFIEKSKFKYLDVRYLIGKEYAKYRKQTLPDEKHRQQTLFESMSGTININNGIASNNDFKAVSKRYLLNGSGSVNLVNETINYTVNIILQNNHGELKLLNNQPIPYVLTGPLSNMKKKLKISKTLERIAKQQLKKKYKEKEKRELDKIKDKLKDKFKDLFK